MGSPGEANANGNCMHGSCVTALFSVSVRNPALWIGTHSWAERETDLANVMADMNAHRLSIYRHLESSLDAFSHPDPEIRQVYDAARERLPAYSSADSASILSKPDSIGNTLFDFANREGYNNGCNPKDWAQFMLTSTIKLLFVTLMVLQSFEDVRKMKGQGQKYQDALAKASQEKAKVDELLAKAREMKELNEKNSMSP